MFLSVAIPGRFTTETHAMALYISADTPPLLAPHPGTLPGGTDQHNLHFTVNGDSGITTVAHRFSAHRADWLSVASARVRCDRRCA